MAHTDRDDPPQPVAEARVVGVAAEVGLRESCVEVERRVREPPVLGGTVARALVPRLVVAEAAGDADDVVEHQVEPPPADRGVLIEDQPTDRGVHRRLELVAGDLPGHAAADASGRHDGLRRSLLSAIPAAHEDGARFAGGDGLTPRAAVGGGRRGDRHRRLPVGPTGRLPENAPVRAVAAR